MKLDQLLFAACVGVVALATGCSAPASQPAKSASTATVSDAVAITQLMSAQLPGPTPKVGKPHLAGDDDSTDIRLGLGVESSSESGSSESGSMARDAIDSSASDGESAPKAVRRSDGSRRHGGFGTTK